MQQLKRIQLALFSLAIISQLSQLFLYKLFYGAVALALMLSVIILLQHPGQARRLFMRSIPLLLLFAHFALTSLWSTNPHDTLHYLAIDLVWIPVFTVCYVTVTNNPLRRCSRVLMPLPVVVLPMFAYAYWRYGSLRPELGASVSSLCNVASVLLCSYLPFFLWMAHREQRGLISKLPSLLIVVLLAISQSRAGIVAGFVSLSLTILVLSKRPRIIVRRVARWCAVLALVLVALRVSDTMRNSLDYTFDRIRFSNYDVFDVTSQKGAYADIDRRLQYAEGIRMAAEHFWGGMGYMAFGSHMSEVYGNRITLHSVFLAIIAESGVVGALIFAFLLYQFFRTCIVVGRDPLDGELRQFARLCAVAMVTILLFGLFGQVHQSFPFYNIYAWGMALDVVRMRRRPQFVARAVAESVLAGMRARYLGAVGTAGASPGLAARGETA